jgi:hypothetical protein
LLQKRRSPTRHAIMICRHIHFAVVFLLCWEKKTLFAFTVHTLQHEPTRRRRTPPPGVRTKHYYDFFSFVVYHIIFVGSTLSTFTYIIFLLHLLCRNTHTFRI